MTPIEKAEELVFKFALKGAETEKIAIECALIVVDEILDNFGLVCNGQTFYTEHRAFDYYSAVKQELTKKHDQ
jgi:hypothetical protein